MIKMIRILEVPIYLLTIALGTYIEGSTTMALVLAGISVTRLIVNVVTDESVYKR
tara:strand:+ start:567 stop:731 length:165 start_codon:yes stop_codon:yes gene_type:complete